MNNLVILFDSLLETGISEEQYEKMLEIIEENDLNVDLSKARLINGVWKNVKYSYIDGYDIG